MNQEPVLQAGEAPRLLNNIVHNLKTIGATPMNDLLTSQPCSSGSESSGIPGPPPRQGSAKSSSPDDDVATPKTFEGIATASAGTCGPSSPLLSPQHSLDVASGPASAATLDPYVTQIEECCMEWRAGLVVPYWLILKEPKLGQTKGCALRIQISTHNHRVYSVDTIYDSDAEAKAACAKAATDQGVLDFIMFGGGQKTPAVKMGPDDGELFTGECAIDSLKNQDVWTVNAFYEALPKTSSELQTSASYLDVNGPSWLNTTLQCIRGARLSVAFIWTEGTVGFHGCLLRLTRPDECKSYLVDARFHKRAEAKHAVCLLAMSQGIGDYFSQVAKEVDARLPPSTRRLVNEVLGPTLLEECRRTRLGNSPQYDYQTDGDACGCTMTVQLVANPTPTQMRTYTVPVEYRNRSDAKIAVVALAAEQGVIEFLRFRGSAPPRGYIPTYAGYGDSSERQFTGKRKNVWEPSNGRGKRPRFNDPRGSSQGVQSFVQAPYTMPASSGYVGAGGLWTHPYGGYPPLAPVGYPHNFSPGGAGPTYPNSHYGLPHVSSVMAGARSPASSNGYLPSTHASATYSQPFQPYPVPPIVPLSLQPAMPAQTSPLSPRPGASNLPTSALPTGPPSTYNPSTATQWSRKPYIPSTRPPTGVNRKVTVRPVSKSSVTELYDYCASAHLPAPQFYNDFVTTAPGGNQHKVWVTVGKQRIELPVTFGSLSQGQECVARRVLEQLQAQSQSQTHVKIESSG